MNITRTLAEEIARKLTGQKERDIKDMGGKFSMAVTLAYQASIPKEVLELFETHKDWMKSVSSVSLMGHGFNYDGVNLSKQLPSKIAEYNTKTFEVNKTNATEWRQQFNAIETAKKDLKKLKIEIENALLSLKTHKRIEENFPEAAKFLGAKTVTAISVNLSSIREQLTTTPDAGRKSKVKN